MNIHERVFFPSHFKNVLNKHWLSWVFFLYIYHLKIKKKIFVTVFAWTHVFIVLGNVPESGIAESWGNSRFNSLKELPDCFPDSFYIPRLYCF